jgi:hypothetical protein
MDEDTRTGRQLVDALVRWQESGGVWLVGARHPGTVEVILLRCDAGEVVDRISSGEPAWLEHLRGRSGSEDS